MIQYLILIGSKLGFFVEVFLKIHRITAIFAH